MSEIPVRGLPSEMFVEYHRSSIMKGTLIFAIKRRTTDMSIKTAPAKVPAPAGIFKASLLILFFPMPSFVIIQTVIRV